MKRFPKKRLRTRRRCLRVVLAACAVAAAGPAWAQPDTSSPEPLLSDNIVIVLDSSGSMRQPMRGAGMTRMQAAKKGLMAVLEQVPETTQVGLLVFSSSSGGQDWLYDLGPVDRDRLRRAIQMPRPGQATPLGEYLKKGADRLLAQRAAQHGYGTFRLLVVTDGEASDSHLVERYLPDLMSRGIIVDCIGVDMASDHALATRVHSYRRANDPASLEQAVREVIGEVGSADGRDTDAADVEPFELIAGLSDEMCVRLVQSLTRLANQPIGESAEDSLAAVDEFNDPVDSSRTITVPISQSRSGSRGGIGMGVFAGLFCLGVIAVMIGVPILIIVLARRSTSSRRRGGSR